ncbi:DUF559 domain-containing protein [Labedaea rhizosphaerae]|nr:DUF559 domain-containing protein [Labedaea rhizosphaerae]
MEQVERRALYSDRYRRVVRDVYVPAGMRVDHVVRSYGAALIARPGAVLTGRSAAAIYGIDLANTYDPVEFVANERDRFGPIRGIRLHRGPVKPSERMDWEGIAIATPLRMAMDLLFRQAPREMSRQRRLQVAVADLDQVLRAGLVDRDVLAALLRRRRDHGVVLARQAVELADPRAESPPESELRVLLTLHDMPPTPQVEVFGKKGFAGRCDMAYESARLAIEYDGRYHFEPAQRRRDEVRLNRFRKAGWRVITITAERLYGDPEGVVRDVRAALNASRAERRAAAMSSGLRKPQVHVRLWARRPAVHLTAKPLVKALPKRAGTKVGDNPILIELADARGSPRRADRIAITTTRATIVLGSLTVCR